MRKTILQYECCKTKLMANFLQNVNKNCNKRNYGMLYRDNAHVGK